jgi:toxin ParE1/3/4
MRVNVSPKARRDVRDILRWSHEQFGREARKRYRRLIQQAFDDLRDDPDRLGVSTRDELAADIRLFHIRHSRRRSSATDRVSTPRHFIIFRRTGDQVNVLRVLHDSMDLASHL